MVYIKDSIGTQNKETNRKGSATNSIDKCNLQIIYGNSKDQIEHYIRYIKEESEVQSAFTKI